MPAPAVDPLLPMMVAGRTLAMNNEFRVKLMLDAAVMFRRDPAGFKIFLLDHLQWGEAEAVMRDRAGEDLRTLPLLPDTHQAEVIPALGGPR